MSLSCRPTALALAALAVLSFASPVNAQSPSTPSEAADDVQHYTIPAGDLGDALRRIARQSGRSLVAEPVLLEGKRASPVEGTMRATDAIRQALRGTGLELMTTASGALSVRQAAAAPAASAPPASAGTSQTLPAITVSASREPASPYVADRLSSVATKIDLPPRMTPFSVFQASETLIVERGDQNIYDTIERFTGVTANNGQSDIGIGMDRYLSVRGFSNASGNDGQMLINGNRIYGGGAGMRGTDSLESVELLRGPASLYYGAAQPGGVFNYNYKRPRADARYVLRARTDSEGSIATMADLTGPLNADKTVQYRLVGSLSRYEDDQAHVWSKPNSFLAALRWNPSPRFDSTLTYERTDVRAVPEKENNKKTVNGEYYPIPRDQSFLGHLNDRARREADTLLWNALWRPADDLKIAANLSWQRSEQWYQVTRPSGSGGGGTPPDPIDGRIPRSVSFSPPSQWESLSGGVDVSGKLRTGGLRHDWLAGIGYGISRTRSMSRPTVSGEFDTGGYVNPRTGAVVRPGRYGALPLDIDTLDNGVWPWRDVVMSQSAFMVPWAERRDTNFYLQDLIHLPDGRTRLMIGAGWSQYDNLARGSYNWNTGVRADDTPFKTQRWTPRVAAMHDITPHATLYASYGQSFAPQPSLTRRDASGNALLKPEQGVQYEIGYKQDLNDGAGLFTLALFRIDKKNIARAENATTCDSTVTDPADPFYCAYTLDGLQRSQGVEVTLSGEILRGWQASLAYTYLDTEIVETQDTFQRGRSFASIPRHGLSLWNRVSLVQGSPWGSLSLGVGLRAQSRMHTTYTASGADWIAGYGVLDLGLFWRYRVNGNDLNVNLNVANVMDRTTYVGSTAPPTGTLIYGPGRRVVLTAQITF